MFVGRLKIKMCRTQVCSVWHSVNSTKLKNVGEIFLFTGHVVDLEKLMMKLLVQ